MISGPVKCGPSVTVTSFLLHTFGFIWYSNGIYHDRLYYNFDSYNAFGGRFQFLTNITCYLIWIVSGIAMIVDIIQLFTKSLESKHFIKDHNTSKLLLIRDELMSFWVFTLGAFVPIMFWGIAAVDLDGIYPERIREMSPLMGWFNQFVHTGPVLYIFVLMYFVNYMHSSLICALGSVSILSVGYVSWMAYCAKMNGFWPYDFMESLTNNQFAVFIIFSVMIFMFIYLIGRKIAASFWTKERRDQYLKDKNL